jgi:hypothetical protein
MPTEAAMAHFFFHFISRSAVMVDTTGHDLLDLVEVRHHASSIMRQCIGTGTVDADWRDWHVHVTDEEGVEVFVTPFSDVIGRLH